MTSKHLLINSPTSFCWWWWWEGIFKMNDTFDCYQKTCNWNVCLLLYKKYTLIRAHFRSSVSIYVYDIFLYVCDYLTLARTMESIFAWYMYTTFHFSLSRYVWIRRKIAKKIKLWKHITYNLQQMWSINTFLLMIL